MFHSSTYFLLLSISRQLIQVLNMSTVRVEVNKNVRVEVLTRAVAMDISCTDKVHQLTPPRLCISAVMLTLPLLLLMSR